MIAARCQRWRRGREAWRPAGELFRPELHQVAEIGELDAKRFVIEHHYSRSYPAARFRVGLLRAGAGERHDLVGVAVFSVPMNQAAVGKYTGLEAAAGAELGRFVLLDAIEANAETWFLGQAFALLRERRPDIRAVISYADPMPRIDAAGARLTPGHVGTIYQAHNGRHVGRSWARTLIMARGGQVVSSRALCKLRNGERGAGGVYARLLELGAPERRPLEAAGEYLARALSCQAFRRVPHPGNFCYAWPLGDRRERRELLERFAPALPYPKLSEAQQ